MNKKIEKMSIPFAIQYKYESIKAINFEVDSMLNSNFLVDLISNHTKDGGDYEISFTISKINVVFKQYVFLSSVKVSCFVAYNESKTSFVETFKKLQNTIELSEFVYKTIQDALKKSKLQKNEQKEIEWI